MAKRLERVSFIALLVMAFASLIFALFADPQKWISTSSVLVGLAGIVQLEISGLFEHWIEKYGDEDQYPYGPPHPPDHR
jgi:membrane protein YdbS with pleckstrin-like domain